MGKILKKGHNHPGKEKQLGLENHVIIDRDFFEKLKDEGIAYELTGNSINILNGEKIRKKTKVDLIKLYKEDSIFSKTVDTYYSFLDYKFMPLEYFIEKYKDQLLYIAYLTKIDKEKELKKY
jgi:hypothetical protein